jgi:hypothetical protein
MTTVRKLNYSCLDPSASHKRSVAFNTTTARKLNYCYTAQPASLLPALNISTIFAAASTKMYPYFPYSYALESVEQ